MSRALVVLAALVLLLASAAVAHGPAHWIQFNPVASWCCTAGDDCRRRSLDFAKEEAGGWRIVSTGEFFPYGHKGLFKSIDNDIWACDRPDGSHPCLFTPGAGASLPQFLARTAVQAPPPARSPILVP